MTVTRERIGDWMQTYTGKAFWPLDPDPEEIVPLDIAHALGMLCRYGGHVHRFYSVAEHCVLISRALERAGEPREVQLKGLLHDATEAYVGDMVRPLKDQIPTYRMIEHNIALAIAHRFEVRPGEPDVVKEYDNRILLNERAVLLHRPPLSWGPVEDLAPLPISLQFWSPQRAQDEYLIRLRELGVEW